jgi:2-hydroxychromene-2-carboxylate isomerase
MAGHRLAEALAGLPVTVEYRPNWEPGPDLREALRARGVVGYYSSWHPFKRRYMFQDVRRLAASYGLHLRWPIDHDPDWSLPHLAYLHARERGRGDEFFRAVFAARFERAANVFDPDVLRALAVECGLDPAEQAAALADGRHRDTVLALFEQAAEDQVFGWPFFVVGRHRFWGHDRLEALAATIREGLSAMAARSGAAA